MGSSVGFTNLYQVLTFKQLVFPIPLWDSLKSLWLIKLKSLSCSFCSAYWPQSSVGQWIEEAHSLDNRHREVIQRFFILISGWSGVYLISFKNGFPHPISGSSIQAWKAERLCDCGLLVKRYINRVCIRSHGLNVLSGVSRWDWMSLIRHVTSAAQTRLLPVIFQD